MTTERRLINPFQLPDWAPMRPLCPWRMPKHREYYVAVDSMENAFDDFAFHMGDLGIFLEDGQLVLTTGHTKCGKSSLINRCADWVATKLDERKIRCEVLDLTSALTGRPQESMPDRMRVVCDSLFVELIRRDLLRSDALDLLSGDRDQPDRIYPTLPQAVTDATALVVLLPKSDLVNEVLRYAALARARILFLVESEHLRDDEVDEIVDGLQQWSQPIVLSVGSLSPGDVRRFASDRLTRHRALGTYPDLDQDTMAAMENLLKSIGETQRALHGTYELKRRNGVDYDENGSVTYQEIVEFRYSTLRDSARRSVRR